MIRLALVAFLTLVSSWRITAAAPAPSAAIPPRTSIIGAEALPGRSGERILVYRASGRTYLAIASTRSRGQISWQQRIEGQLVRLLVPGPAGVFAAVTHRPHGASLYAFKLTAQGVVSAVTGRRKGRIYGDEGIVIVPGGFQIRERDWQLQGSVAYRYVTEYDLRDGQYTQQSRRRMPDYPSTGYPTPNAMFHTANGDTILLKLEVASTEAQRQYGLMYRQSLDPDSGMVFTWTSPVQESFWMENTLIPLTVAFIGSDDRVQEMQDMQAETCTFHTPSQPYEYAIEANLGFFAANGIRPGDQVTMHVANAPAPVAAPQPSGTPVMSCGALRNQRLVWSAK